MNLELAIQLATLISVIIGIITLFFAFYSYRRQMNAQVFIEFTGRYEKIMDGFPNSARVARLNLDAELPPESDELSMVALKYLNLCSEEFYLCKRGYLAKDVWKIWECELHRTLQSPLFMREWGKLSGEFGSYPEFRKYVEEVQGKAPFAVKA